ncbi:MAG: 2OG-Fe(II) oxygenase [Phycisphaerales bacterium]|nr:2OG-Fe(II) oxygenase [Phycisphaerales bacterium]
MTRSRSLHEQIQEGIDMSSPQTADWPLTGINPIDQDALKSQVRSSKPVKNFAIENFLDLDFANEVHDCFPSFEEAKGLGKNTASSINEQNKYQVSDSTLFKPALLRLHEMLASDYFCSLLSNVFEIPNLLPDAELAGGGIHQTGPRGHLDVHLDFNYMPERKLFRRMNILIYFNKDWNEDWGGNIELWDEKVKNCVHSFPPTFNRCVVFETNEISYHGVTAVKCPEGNARKSFAGYYYTTETPDWWDGKAHSTVFKARPDEKLKGTILMPADRIRRLFRRVRRGVGRLVK